MDREQIRSLLEEINSKLFLLEGDEDKSSRQKILDELLERESSPIKRLAEMFGIKI
jgi:hypothetical protein